MKKLNIKLINCYGIKSLDTVCDFKPKVNKKDAQKAYAIYAPNGVMKSSFAKTFKDLSLGKQPKEERFNRVSECNIEIDGEDIHKEQIFVLDSEIQISSESSAVSNILINKKAKSEYDELLANQNKLKAQLIVALQKHSGVKKTDVENVLMKDFEVIDFIEAIHKADSVVLDQDLSMFKYADIFNSGILENDIFSSNAKAYNERYQELFMKPGTPYRKGLFSPGNAEKSFSELNKNGFFKVGHKVQLDGEDKVLNSKQVEEKVAEINKFIEGDAQLKKIKTALSKNANTQKIPNLLEKLKLDEIALFLSKTKKDHVPDFRREIWAQYICNEPLANQILQDYNQNKKAIQKLEDEASKEAPRWEKALKLFNSRFVDMPFTLDLYSRENAILGKQKAELKFVFKDRETHESKDCRRSELKLYNLSQGEQRALYLLDFIFEVEQLKEANHDVLFVIDDPADSFDYKNKHAIVQYLEDLTEVDKFHQIILTHNFDLFRTLSLNYIHYSRCLMANRVDNGIELVKAEGIKNIFINKWKKELVTNDVVFCASIPFTRNIIEYTRGEEDEDYLTLTSLLHWKESSQSITADKYLEVYNNTFVGGLELPTPLKGLSVVDLIFTCCDQIIGHSSLQGINLEEKVTLSIGIRLRAEMYLIERIREIINEPDYYCASQNQFGSLMKKFSNLAPSASSLNILSKVSVTVSSNIHLNSFMYEPILDLSIEHLSDLYKSVLDLN